MIADLTRSVMYVCAWAERERDLGREFRRVREQLEQGIRRQFGALQEAFGQLIVQEAVRPRIPSHTYIHTYIHTCICKFLRTFLALMHYTRTHAVWSLEPMHAVCR